MALGEGLILAGLIVTVFGVVAGLRLRGINAQAEVLVKTTVSTIG